MTELQNIENITEKFEEVKTIAEEIKNSMMHNEDCNNQFYNVIQTLENITSGINSILNEKSQPTDEYTILQTNILEVKKELSRINENVDNTINKDLKDLMSKLTEKVNRLEILTNNSGIDQQVVFNSATQTEKNVSSLIKKSSDTLSQNMKECVDYLEKSFKTVSEESSESLSADISLLGKTVEKTTDNLKRSIIDIFTRIQEKVEDKSEENGTGDDNIEMLKTGLYNLNMNTEQKLNKLNKVIEEMDIFSKLENFAKIKDLPAIGELKSTLRSNIDKVVEKYADILQTSQNRDELTKATQQFRKDVYNVFVSMLGNVSEYLLDNNTFHTQTTPANTQMDNFSERIEELTSVTELNNAGYDTIQIQLKDIIDRCAAASEEFQDYAKKSNAKKASVEETINEIKDNVIEIKARGESLRKNSSEVGEVVRECAKSIIENSEPDRITIKDMLSDIKKNISILQSGDEESDYTYSMQDIESDIAKIRIYLNELSQNGITVNSEEFTDELNSIVVMVDSMKQQLNKIDETNLADTMVKMKDDMTSISTRVNKLLLSSDNSYTRIDSTMKEFKALSEEIDEQIKNISDNTKYKNLEDGLTEVKIALSESNSYNSVINESLIMLAEWVDNAGETITNIYEKQINSDSLDEMKDLMDKLKSAITENTDNILSSVKSMIDETNSAVRNIEPADYSETLRVLDGKLAEQNILIEKQEERISKLDEKLTTVLELIAKNDSGMIDTKLSEIDAKMEKLNKSIEKLTSFVSEE